MTKNKETLGTHNFITEFYQDLKSGIATGWWNEKLRRRTERISAKHEDNTLSTVYDLIEYIKENYDNVSEASIKELSEHVIQVYPLLRFKRGYIWEVKDVQETPEDEPPKQEGVLEEDTSEQEGVQEKSSKEDGTSKKEIPVPDFDYAKTLDDKQELKAYAKSFGFDLDSRKSLNAMMKSFQGKFHASKGK